MFSWQPRSKGLRPRRWLSTNKQHKRLLLANQEPNVLSFPPLYLQLNPLGHKVTVPAKDNNHCEVIILDSATYPEVKMKTNPLFAFSSNFQGRTGPSASPPPFLSLCQLQAPRLSPEMPVSHRCLSYCLPDGNGLLNKLPDFSLPLGISFQCYLVTSVFLQLDDVQKHKNNASSRGYQPAAHVAISDLTPEVPLCIKDH